MTDSPKSPQSKKQNLAGALVSVGLALLVIAFIVEGVLRWIVFAATFAVIVFAIILATRKANDNGSQSQ